VKAEKVAEEEPAATVMDGGTVSSTFSLASATVVPSGGAAWLKLTVHTVVAPALMTLGLQASEDGTTRGSKLISNCRDAPLKVAVNVATCNWLIRRAVAANVAEVVFAGTITKGAGTGSRSLLLTKLTTVPPFGAAWFRVMLQVVADPEFTLVGLQTNDDTVIGAVPGGATLIVTDWETRLGTTAEASFEYSLSALVSSTAVVT
jgi:hypothetical protein